MPRTLISLTILAAATSLFAQDRQALETALGNAMAAEVRRHTTPLENPSAEAYAESVVQRLSAHMPNGPATWTPTLVQESIGGPTHEPIAELGGFLFIPAQLFLSAENESEFAGMLAHAMAHVVEKHGIKTASTQGGIIGSVQRSGPTYEREADQLAVKTIAAAGFSPDAFLAYIRRTQPPPLPQRISQLEEAIANTPTPHPAEPPSNFAVIQQEIRAAVAQVPAHTIPSLLHPHQ